MSFNLISGSRKGSRTRGLVVGAGLAVLAAGLTPVAATANPAGTDLVITEAYLNGGSTGAAYTHKYVEIHNPTAADIPLTGLSLQYRSGTGTGNASAACALTGTVAAGDYFLVQAAANTGGGGAALPTPNQTCSGINPSGSVGQLFVATGTSVINPGSAGTINSAVKDLVGYGSTTTAAEGNAPATAASLTTSIQRTKTALAMDTDNNAADFATSAPTPDAAYVPPPPPDEFTGTIAEIQGTQDVSPHVGDIVTTRGVVTAVYPTGGFNGFYLQTPGTGGPRDLTAASDGIFVFTGSNLPAVATKGNYVQVVGEASEFFGMTQITPSAVTDVDEVVTAPTASTTATWPTSNTQRESLEGMLYRPTGDYTVTNTFTTNQFGEVGLASGNKPLIQRTEVELPGPAGASAVEADNLARIAALDDGASTNFTSTSSNAAICGGRPTPCFVNGDQTPAYISNTAPVTVGAAVTFTDDVIVDYRNSLFKFQPTTQVVGPANSNSPATFENIRTAAPDEALINEVGQADLKIASFNVLNYFTTLGDANDDNVGDNGCTPFRDRDFDGVTVNGGCNQRGAWDPQDFARQQSKIVSAINALDADVVGLMEIENSLTLGEVADEATNSLVAALNAAAGAGTWAANPSSTELPASGMDVITSAIIYKPASVDRVGEARALGTLSDDGEAFGNAREPIAQVFEPDAGGDPFLFAVNHFKSKGSAGPNPGDTDSGDGQALSNGSRKLQAAALRDWVAGLQTETGVESVILGGDFNSYAMEDPLQILYTAGYTNVEQEFDNGEYSYSFSGLSGSLDHILVNDVALDRSTGTDIWNINGGESLALEYSRWNYHATDFHAAGPYRSSDHDPVILGFESIPEPAQREIQILGTNDFHGRILNENGQNGTSAGPVAGAEILSGAVKQLRGQNPDTVFAAAGDLIGASTFESFIQNDKPTIDALNEAGLEVSAVGNHELDQGYNDLVNRVMAPYDATTNPLGGAEWEYIAANLRKKSDDSHAVPDSWIKEFGSVEVGFVGAVTEDLPSLVSPDGIADIKVTDIVTEVNASADALEADGADVIVLLMHEGAPNTTYASAVDPNNAFGQIVNGVDSNIDAIVSGHTHLAYNHSVPVPAWAARAVKERPVVSAGQYGTNLNQIKFTVDTATGDVVAKTQALLNLKAQSAPFAANYPVDPAVTPIVNDAVAKAEVLGAVELGKVAGPFNRAKLANGTTENRGGESTLGNLVAEVQRWATSSPEAGAAQIAFMNPGGLRQDMRGKDGGYPATLTYKQAAVVQPFANTLVNMQLTGAQIKTALEQQWQRDSSNNIPSRPFLRLGTSKGFRYTYDPTRPETDRITGMWLNGTPIAAGTSYSVTVNSFLGSGGDNFRVFAQGAQKRDTGKVDLEAMVDYMDTFANTAEGDAPLPVDFTQHSVGVAFPASAPASYRQGDEVTFNLSSLAFSNPTDVKDTEVKVRLGGTLLGTFPVDNTIGIAVFDEYGTAAVTVTVPNGTPDGRLNLEVSGNNTPTRFDVPITVNDSRAASQVTASDVSIEYGKPGAIDVTVSPDATGTVELFDGATSLGTATLADSEATFALAARSLDVGVHTLRVDYAGDANVAASSTNVQVTVTRASTSAEATASPTELEANTATSTITVKVTGENPSGLVGAVLDGQVIGGGELADGTATFTVGPFSTAGTKSIDVRYYGDDRNRPSATSVSVVVKAAPVVEKATPTITATADPTTLKVKKDSSTVSVTVTRPTGTATGTVLALVDNKVVGAGELVAGKTAITVGPFDTVGTKTITLRYLGDDNTKAAAGSVSVTVQKATPTLTVKVPKKVVKGKKAYIVVKPAAAEFVPAGTVTVQVAGKKVTKTVQDGKAVFKIRMTSVGKKTVKVSYSGDERTESATDTDTIRVVKP